VECYGDLIQGESVTMNEGPLKGLTATVIEVRNSLRLVVSIELLRRSVLVEIDRDWVVPYRFSNPPYGWSSFKALSKSTLTSQL
jgi:hypothetical protein